MVWLCTENDTRQFTQKSIENENKEKEETIKKTKNEMDGSGGELKTRVMEWKRVERVKEAGKDRIVWRRLSRMTQNYWNIQ